VFISGFKKGKKNKKNLKTINYNIIRTTP